MNMPRKRKYDPTIPAHIDQDSLPTGCYWKKRDRCWYFSNGKTRKRIAGEKARLGDLHNLTEQHKGHEVNTFNWLASMYHESFLFDNLAPKTQINYLRSESIISQQQSKLKTPLGKVDLNYWCKPLVQRLVEKVAANNGPKAANDCLKHIRIVFKFGINNGYWKNVNPGEGIYKAIERKRQRLIEPGVLPNLIQFAQQRGSLSSRAAGSCAPYIWCVLVIGYECRGRGFETNNICDADLTEDGIIYRRGKGSRTNIVMWNESLRHATIYLIKRRNKIWDKRSLPVPVKADSRFLFVNETGGKLAKSSLDGAFARLIKLAIKEKVITEDQRFGIHDLKRRGTTDTKGTRADKQEATGHKSASVVDIYDKSISLVKPVSD